MSDEGREFLRDERGGRSMGRLLLTIALSFTAGIVLAATSGADVPGPVWPLLTSVDMALIGWVAGPRIAQHLQLGAAAQAVASAVKRKTGTDDRYEDDERG